MRTLYPEIEPNNTGFLKVDETHLLYWEESGNPKGKPILFLHGGPGTGTNSGHRRFFDPNAYRIILFDQRGAGKSTPHSCLINNTTWDLVEDIEKLRAFLLIDKWVVFGGSWGSTLGLAYTEKHPERVLALILRGIFLCRQKEIDWFYQFGAHLFLPDMWEKFLAPIPLSEREDLVKAYFKRLTSEDPQIRQKAAKAWTSWEGCALKLHFDPALFDEFTQDFQADSIARIECHYFINKSFFRTDNYLIENASKIRSIPGVIVHGRYDLICPFESAWELHKAWPEAELNIIPDAGHTTSEPGIMDALITATDRFR